MRKKWAINVKQDVRHLWACLPVLWLSFSKQKAFILSRLHLKLTAFNHNEYERFWHQFHLINWLYVHRDTTKTDVHRKAKFGLISYLRLLSQFSRRASICYQVWRKNNNLILSQMHVADGIYNVQAIIREDLIHNVQTGLNMYQPSKTTILHSTSYTTK